MKRRRLIMGGAKQNYIITFASATVPESIYLTFGNGKYARQIFSALNAYYCAAGYESDFNQEKNYCMLYKRDAAGNVIDNETLLFKFYQKQLMWKGQLPADLAILESFIPEAAQA